METLTHRLVLPADANHYGTLYAGALLKIALEAGYSTAYRIVGFEANLVLRRVLDLQCYRPVNVGTVIEIRGTTLLAQRTYMVVGLVGSPLPGERGPWMDGIMSFVQVRDGRPAAFPVTVADYDGEDTGWVGLRERARKLMHIR